MSNISTISAIMERRFTTTSVKCTQPECDWTVDISTEVSDTEPDLIEDKAGKLAYKVFRDLVAHMRDRHDKHVTECPGPGYADCTCAQHQRGNPNLDSGSFTAEFHKRKQAKRAASVQAMLDGKAFADQVANAIRSVINPEVHHDPNGVRDDIGYVYDRNDIASRITEELGDRGLLRDRVCVAMSPNTDWYLT